MADPAARRRMPSDERRAQLVDVAVEEVAERGYAGLSFDAVAERAGVTRNLLYHYFPRRRQDLFVAAMQRVGEVFTDGWVTDEAIPLEERLTANFARFIEHAREPSAAWRCLRQGRIAHDPEASEMSRAFFEVVVDSVALNHFGTTDPGPAARAALHAYVAYAEELLDRWREERLDDAETFALLRGTLLAIVELTKSK